MTLIGVDWLTVLKEDDYHDLSLPVTGNLQKVINH